MEKNELILKAKFNPIDNGVYSICMRGARLWDKTQVLDIYNGVSHYKAIIVSQQHISFLYLNKEAYVDNYDETARTYDGLREAMGKLYPNLDPNEIVTILRFKIINHQ